MKIKQQIGDACDRIRNIILFKNHFPDNAESRIFFREGCIALLGVALVFALLQAAGLIATRYWHDAATLAMGPGPTSRITSFLVWPIVWFAVGWARHGILRFVWNANVLPGITLGMTGISMLPLATFAGLNGLLTCWIPVTSDMSNFWLIVRIPIWTGLPLIGVIWDAAIWVRGRPGGLEGLQSFIVWFGWIVPASILYSLLGLLDVI